MHRLFRQDIDQFGYMFADRAPPIFVEGRRKPNCSPIGQRAKARVEMIKTWINKFHRDDEATEHVRNGPMRLNIGAKLVAAKKHVAAEEGISLAFEVEIVGQPANFIAMFFHPARKMRRFASTLPVAEIARNEFAANREPGVGRENHVGKFSLRRDQM